MGASHRRGYYGESKAAKLLAVRFPDAARQRQTGTLDEGDIGGIPDTAVEVKFRSSGKRLAISSGLHEAVAEAENAGMQWPVLIHNRPRMATEDWYWVMRAEDGRDLLAEWHERGERISELEAELNALRAAIGSAMSSS